ncbi:1-acyl-sn-glycerol-3-phosphate acyltransferase [Acinetobacter zhairhuonensis]|uniref:1-acyl-sn-glycerol-3-phosphate acyltransferase n=1 Tax=Acinetobacter sp. A7.4 TaxID=2919921 RepID=UPI001F4F7790|nr:1-acyl-sn-glycerol-3-phosphate acyltransferase [Acinetobacter sp. A7.4]MCJ8162354.1 1-acyl-sn-glycerol-3-phosphate acyltransferase [Acinetobacter sp. A7.4]
MSKPYFPILPPHVPARGSAFSKQFFRRLFLAQGWSFAGEFPDLAKAVAIISPHTSNMDAWYGFSALLGLGIQITVFGKHTLFKTPLKPLLEWVGVIPVNRTTPHGLTEQIIQIIQNKEQIWVGMAPEGTRKSAGSIKSGFYRIAVGAQIPIVMFAFDYDHKTIRCLGVFHPGGNYEQDLPQILAHYAGQFSAKNPAWLAKPLQTLVKK